MNVSPKYLFTLTLIFDSTPVGSFPEGRRIDVRYRGSVTTDPAKYQAAWGQAYTPFVKDTDGSTLPIAWGGLDGKVIAGADSVLVRSDSVAVFAGRLTIRATDGYLINTQLTGEVDLSKLFGQKSPTLKSFFDADDRTPSTIAKGPADAVLGLSFEGATATQGFAAAELTQQTFFRYQRLLRGAFVASGKVHFNGENIDKAELDVLALEAI